MDSTFGSDVTSGRDSRFLNVERIGAFSDGIMAVAITLLVLNIQLPKNIMKLSGRELATQLGRLWPHYEAFVLSFVIIGAYWIFHHLMFRYVQKYDGGFLWLNLFFLMCIVLIPFTSSVISEYGQTALATIIYAANVALASLLMAALWWYCARGKRLVGEAFEESLAHNEILSFLITTAVFVASMPIALLNARVAKYSWLLLFPIHYFLDRVKPRQRYGPRAEHRAE